MSWCLVINEKLLQPFGFSRGRFASALVPNGARPPPITGTFLRPAMVSCPIQPNPSQQMMMTSFTPTPRLPTREPSQNQG